MLSDEKIKGIQERLQLLRNPRDASTIISLADDVASSDLPALLKEIERLKADAERYRFLTTVKLRSTPHMGGNHYWRFESGGWPQLRGQTIDDAIDKAMAELAASYDAQKGTE